MAQTVAITGASAGILANRVVPALLDRYLARTGFGSQQTAGAGRHDRPDNLWAPVDDPQGTDHGALGEFDDRSHPRSAQLRLSEHPVAVTAVGAATLALGVPVAVRGRRDGKR
jgi:hypothetical protein